MRTESLATLDGATRARVLQRQYALLVSMAPMEPLCEHVYTAGLPVMHFGPTFSLLTSPWLQLALYTALGCGPPSILLPRGARLRRVPEGLRPYSHLLLTPWGGEPNVTSTSHLLSVAAELLTRAPLLVQAYVADASAGTARLPMPVADAAETLESPPAATPSPAMPTGEGSTRTDTEAEGAHEDAHEGDHDGAHEGAHEDASRYGEGPHAAARRVMHALGLESSIGMLQLVRVQAAADAGGPPSTAWVPLMLHFGLPLCDVPTCEAVCAQVRQRLLFSASRTGAACKCSPRRLASFPAGAAATALQCEPAAGPHRRSARAAAARARLRARVHGQRGGSCGQGHGDRDRGGERRDACRLGRERHVPVRTALLRRPLHASARRSGEVRCGVRGSATLPPLTASPAIPRTARLGRRGGGGERAWRLSVSPSSGLWSLPSGGCGLDWRRNMWDTLTSVSLLTGGLPAATPAPGGPDVRSHRLTVSLTKFGNGKIIIGRIGRSA